jgi:RNA polymerase sigma-70 factor (ECF subfamily)
MNDDAFERLFSEHAPSLLAFLVYRTNDVSLAEDLVASTFERALKARDRFNRRRGSEKTWLYTIALNLLRDQARHADAEQRAYAKSGEPGSHETSGEWIEQVGERAALAQALSLLSDEEREVIALRFGGDLTVPEVAKALGLRHSTVEGRLYSGLRKLRERLNTDDAGVTAPRA